MTEHWSKLSTLIQSYCNNSGAVTSCQIEAEIKSLLSHQEDIVDVLVYAANGVTTITLFSISPEKSNEAGIHAYIVKYVPSLTDKVKVNIVSLADDAICKGQAICVPDDAPSSLAQAFTRTAKTYPTKTLTFHEANGQVATITYQQLYHNARNMAARLIGTNDRRGKAAVLVAGELSVYITAFWGCVLAGRPSLTVMLAPDYNGDDINKSKLSQAITVLKPEFVLCCDEGFKRISQSVEILSGADLLKVSDMIGMDLRTGCVEIHETVSPLFYQLTSGSTGEAKVIPISETAVLAQIYSVNQFCGYHCDHVSLNWLPFDHVIALLAVHIHDVYLGRQQIHLATPLVLAEPLFWLRQLEQYQVTHCFAPNFVFRLVLEQLADEPDHGICDLSRLEQIVSGGEAVSAEAVSQFIRTFEPAGLKQTVIQPSYGMAEAAAGVSFEREWGAAESVIDLESIDGGDGTKAYVTSLGRVLPGLSVRVVDAKQQLLKEREIGEIQLLGQKMCHGGDGWFRTGDLGFVDQQRLFVTGRLKDVIIVNGANYYSHQLEEVVAGIEGVRSGYVAVVSHCHNGSESVAVFYVPENEECVSSNDSYYLSQIATIRGELGKTVGLTASVVLPVTRQYFPKTSIGKIKRASLQESLKAGEHTGRIQAIAGLLSARLAAPSHQSFAPDIHSELREIWTATLKTEDVDESANFFELGGNSVLSARLIGQINRRFGLSLDTIALFEAPSLKLMRELISHCRSAEGCSEGRISRTGTGNKAEHRDIAIIGLAGIFPGAATIDEFWHKLIAGQDLMTQFSAEELAEAGLEPAHYGHEDYVARGGVVAGTHEFDAAFFGYPLKDAELMDPQSRLLHQQCWHALESAGYVPSAYPGAIGLYVGASSSCNMDWMCRASEIVDANQFSDTMTLHTLADRDFIATRIAYALGLTGPAVTVQTACSTGLVATHTAIQALREGNCDIALSGAAAVKPAKQGYRRQNGMMLSQSGVCRPFDANADGTVFTEGVGIVAMKLLDHAVRDGDNIFAVIKGSAVNNDGRQKAGYLAPGIPGQEAVLRDALADAKVTPDSIGYIEAHGTATQLGDPIEVRALANVFNERKGQPCRLGSVKSNIGHAEAAAGMAGLIKSALAVYHQQVPATLHYQQANPQIDFSSIPFQVNRQLWDWEGARRPYRAGVSSFGIGGTNAHMIVEEPPRPAVSGKEQESWAVLPVSAQSASALKVSKRQLADYVSRPPQATLNEVAYTLGVGREHFSHRQAIVCRTQDEARQALEQQSPILPSGQKKALFFMFPGQGAQFPGMLSELLTAYSPFRHVVNQCLALLPEPERADLSDIMRGDLHGAEKLNDTRLVQPALFIVQYSLAKVVMKWGVVPKGMIGHSLGEYVAAAVSGVMTLGDALNLVVVRGRLMSQADKGSMLGVSLSKEQAGQYLSETVNLAAVNGPRQCVLSGSCESIDKLEQRLGLDNVSFQRLPVSHAYHSYMMDAILAQFASYVATVPMQAPAIPYISTLTGDWITGEVQSPDYWVKHLRETVCFDPGIQRAMKEQNMVFLDMGPGKTLGSLLRQHPVLQPTHSVISLTRHQKETSSDIEPLFNAAASLYESGFDIDWAQLNLSRDARRTPLPLYPFEKQTFELVMKGKENYRIYEPDDIEASAPETLGKRARPILAVPFRAPATPDEKVVAEFWSEELGIIQPGLDDEFFELGGDSLVMLRLVNRINEHFGTGLTVAALMEAKTIADQVMVVELISANQADESENFEMDLGELL